MLQLNLMKLGQSFHGVVGTDLVDDSILHKIATPSLFIVGGKDNLIITFNKRALKEIKKYRFKRFICNTQSISFF